MDPPFFLWVWIWGILGFTLDFGTVLSEDPIWILHEDLKDKEFMK